MKDFLLIILIIAAMSTVIILMIWLNKKLDIPDEEAEEKEIDQEEGTAENTEEFPYIKTYLLTKNEWAFYKAIKPIADKYKLHIIAKVRIADIVSVKKGLSNKERSSAFNRIKSKHFDFLLCDPQNLAVKAAIELDDSSHDEIDRQQRDFFVDNVCETIKLPLIRVTDSNGFEEKMCKALKIKNKC